MMSRRAAGSSTRMGIWAPGRKPAGFFSQTA